MALRLSEYERAEELFAESVTLASAMDNRELVAECLAGIAAAHAARSPARLARLLGASTGLHETIDTTISEDEDWIMSQFVGAARAKLGKDRFAAEWARGKAMSLEEAVEYAVGRRDETEP